MNEAANPTYSELISENNHLRSEVENLKQNELKLLRLLQELKNDKYGRRTEKLSNLSLEQLALLELEDVEVPEQEEKVGSYTRKKQNKPRSFPEKDGNTNHKSSLVPAAGRS